MDTSRIRRDFPITHGDRIYLDNASLAAPPSFAVAAIARAYEEQSCIGVDAYWKGLEIANETRAHCARLINADVDEIALVENTGTGINIVVNMLDWSDGDNVVLNDLEFFPYQWTRLKKHGVEVRVIRSTKPNGVKDVTLEDLRAACDARTRVIALSHVSFINGLKQDLTAVSALAKEYGAYVVVDAIQSVGALQVDVRHSGVDFCASGGHKWLLGPLGTGFFYCRRDLIEKFEPAYIGWHSDRKQFNSEFRSDYVLASTAERFMPGNFNMGGVYGLHASTQYLLNIGMEEIESRNMALANRLVEGIQALGLGFLSPLRKEARSQIVTFLPTDVEKTIQALAEAKISVVQRSAGIRVSPNFFNEEWEIDRLLEVVREVERRR